jgi:hypothetical protein
LNIFIFDHGGLQSLPAALVANPSEQEPDGRVADAGVQIGFQTGEHGLEGAGITVRLGHGLFQGPPGPPLRHLVVGCGGAMYSRSIRRYASWAVAAVFTYASALGWWLLVTAPTQLSPASPSTPNSSGARRATTPS